MLMKNLHDWFKASLVMVIFLVVLLIVTGCSPDPMVSYARQLEEKKLIQAFEELDADINAVDSYFNALFAKDIDDVNTEDIGQVKVYLATIKTKVLDIKATADEIDAGSDEKVREAVSHFNDTIYYLDKLVDEMAKIFDLADEMIIVYGDVKNEKISYSAFLSEMDRIDESLDQANNRIEDYIDNMDQSFNKWQAIMDQSFN